MSSVTRVESVSQVAALSDVTFPPHKKKQQGLEDSLAISAEQTLLPPLKPTLPKSAHFDFGSFVTTMADNLDKLRQLIIRNDLKTIEDKSTHLAEAKASMLKKMREIDQKDQQSASWMYLQKIVYSISSSLSVVSGANMLGYGGLYYFGGGALIVSGALGIAGISMADAGIDPKTTGMIALVSAALAIGGGGLSFTQGAQSAQEYAIKIAQGAVSLLSGVYVVGSELNHYQKARLETLSGEFRHQMNENQTLFDLHSTELMETVKHLENTRVTSKLLRKIRESLSSAIALGAQV